MKICHFSFSSLENVIHILCGFLGNNGLIEHLTIFGFPTRESCPQGSSFRFAKANPTETSEKGKWTGTRASNTPSGSLPHGYVGEPSRRCSLLCQTTDLREGNTYVWLWYESIWDTIHYFLPTEFHYENKIRLDFNMTNDSDIIFPFCML